MKGHSIWSISCSWHATEIFDPFYSGELSKVPEKTGMTMQDATKEFVFMNKQVVQIDLGSWP